MTGFFRLMKDEPFLVLIATTLVALLLTLAGLIYWSINLANERAARWTEFARTHDCKIVARSSGGSSTTTGVVFNAGKVGVVTGSTYTAGKTGWLCNDGITYWR